MEDNGARSNPLETDKDLHMVRLVGLKHELLDRGEARPAHPTSRSGRRQGMALGTVIEVLRRGERMTVREIHEAVEEALGSPVSVSTVKDALSAHACGDMPRLRRVRRGVYVLANEDVGSLGRVRRRSRKR